MTDDPWLSVIIPVHKGEQFLAATLASAAAEKPEGVEFRIYDSGDDGGAARRVADPFFAHMKIFWQDVPDLKPWTAKTNKGVYEAGATHIVMLHQDDLWLPGHLSVVRRAIANWPEVAMSVASSRFVAADGRLLSAWRLPFTPGLHRGATIADALLVQNSIAIPSPVIRRDAWLACGGMDEALWYTADWDLYLKLARLSDVVVRERMTTGFRLHGSSLTMAGSREAAEFRGQLERVLEKHIENIEILPREIDIARASIAVNCALAAAGNGDFSRLTEALFAIAKLGPRRAIRYIRQSRIIDRMLPRLRLSIAGSL
ncbi:glycosyl transferase family 2 [Sphingobium chlorophenolicum L-1]|uniref:Glycosyl transferase family 2 n=1 Tax=Sphingobium chlorophenolicum L-1 TaxID=690566 RepID=F6F0S9_SPHCR|nr:glycosyltransferase [Sphingobium chlorophenolicum]AEG50401.1 glycosyl transferase family 2 [Sphingobium chlorophenolicum L-1]